MVERSEPPRLIKSKADVGEEEPSLFCVRHVASPPHVRMVPHASGLVWPAGRHERGASTRLASAVPARWDAGGGAAVLCVGVSSDAQSVSPHRRRADCHLRSMQRHLLWTRGRRVPTAVRMGRRVVGGARPVWALPAARITRPARRRLDRARAGALGQRSGEPGSYRSSLRNGRGQLRDGPVALPGGTDRRFRRSPVEGSPLSVVDVLGYFRATFSQARELFARALLTRLFPHPGFRFS